MLLYMHVLTIVMFILMMCCYYLWCVVYYFILCLLESPLLVINVAFIIMNDVSDVSSRSVK